MKKCGKEKAEKGGWEPFAVEKTIEKQFDGADGFDMRRAAPVSRRSEQERRCNGKNLLIQ